MKKIVMSTLLAGILLFSSCSSPKNNINFTGTTKTFAYTTTDQNITRMPFSLDSALGQGQELLEPTFSKWSCSLFSIPTAVIDMKTDTTFDVVFTFQKASIHSGDYFRVDMTLELVDSQGAPICKTSVTDIDISWNF